MSDQAPQSDRRPLASRNLRVMQRLAAALARAGVSPNAISLASLVVGILGGVVLAASAWVEADLARRLLYLGAIACIQSRLLCNMIDGMVAIEGNRRSALGELYNEIPDRISDAATLIGAGYAAGSAPELGYVAALVAVLTAYIRAVGKGCGVGNDFGGPMAKPHRMALLTGCCAILMLAPEAWLPHWRGMGLMALGLAIMVAGASLTCVLRLSRIAAKLKGAGA